MDSEKTRTHEPTTRELVAEFDGFCKLMSERDRRYADKFEAADEKNTQALTSSKEAVSKAETATEKRFDAVNEFRKTLSDQATNFVSRAEFSAKLDAMADKLEGLRLLFSERKGHSLGTTATLGAMAVACGLISGLVFGILNLILKR